MPYLGVAPNPRENREVDDISSGFNGGTTQFTLQSGGSNVSPGKDTAIIVSLGGVIQNPGTDYTIAASTITFTTAPASGLSFFGVVLAQSIDIETVADNTVTTAKIVDGAVTNAKVNASAAIAGTKISPDFGSQAISTTNNSVTIGDSIIHSGDTNTKIRFPAANQFTVETGGSQRMSLSSSGIIFNETGENVDFRIEGDTDVNNFYVDASTNRIGIGQSAPEGKLHIENGSSGASYSADGADILIVENSDSVVIDLRSPSSNGCGIIMSDNNARARGSISYTHSNDAMSINTAGSERIRIDSSGKVGIGNTSPASFDAFADLLVVGTTSGNNGITIVAGSSNHSSIYFADGTSGGSQKNAGIVDYNHSTDTMRFATAADNAMVINSNRDISMGTTSVIDSATLSISNRGNNGIGLTTGINTTQNMITFRNDNGVIGSIKTNGSGTSFNTSSDYRLKENATAIADGITRIKTLKPYRFNFKTDASTTVDGFFAHEVTPVVPEAITGEKDGMKPETYYQEGDTLPSGKVIGDVKTYSSTKPEYQGIDQSKLVPLLVAAVQELIGKVEALEAA